MSRAGEFAVKGAIVGALVVGGIVAAALTLGALATGTAFAVAAPVVALGALAGVIKGGIIGAFTKSKDEEVAEALSPGQGRGHVHVHEHYGPAVETTIHRDRLRQQEPACERIR